MPDLALLACIAIGTLLGVISGLTPGLHLNNFAAMLLAISPQLLAWGLSPFQVASVILSASISQTFFDAIPAVFLGAPDSETALSALPGQRMMQEGRAVEAVRLSALGSAGSVPVALLIIWPLSWAAFTCYDYLTKYVGVLLLGIAWLMIRSEMGPQIEGQGRLVHYKYKAIALLLFLTSGLLGLFAFGHESLLASPLGLEAQVLLPLLSGIFGASSLMISLSGDGEVAEQKESEINLPAGALARAVVSGSLGGSAVAWIPGVSASVAALTVRLGAPAGPEEFLVNIGGANTANALFSLVALYVIGRPRSGAAAAIAELMDLDGTSLACMIIIVVIVAAISFLATLWAARLAARAVSRVNYRLLCLLVLLFLTAMSYAFTGTFGLFIFFLSTVVGLIAPVAGIRRTHAMGVLMLPLIVRYL